MALIYRVHKTVLSNFKHVQFQWRCLRKRNRNAPESVIIIQCTRIYSNIPHITSEHIKLHLVHKASSSKYSKNRTKHSWFLSQSNQIPTPVISTGGILTITTTLHNRGFSLSLPHSPDRSARRSRTTLADRPAPLVGHAPAPFSYFAFLERITSKLFRRFVNLSSLQISCTK